jgi:hypothetical protein
VEPDWWGVYRNLTLPNGEYAGQLHETDHATFTDAADYAAHLNVTHPETP